MTYLLKPQCKLSQIKAKKQQKNNNRKQKKKKPKVKMAIK